MKAKMFLDGRKYVDKFGNEGNNMFVDDVTREYLAVNFVSMDDKVLTDDYDAQKCEEMIKICPEIFLVLPKKIAQNKVEMLRLYNVASKSVFNYLTTLEEKDERYKDNELWLREVTRVGEIEDIGIRAKKKEYLAKINAREGINK